MHAKFFAKNGGNVYGQVSLGALDKWHRLLSLPGVLPHCSILRLNLLAVNKIMARDHNGTRFNVLKHESESCRSESVYRKLFPIVRIVSKNNFFCPKARLGDILSVQS